MKRSLKSTVLHKAAVLLATAGFAAASTVAVQVAAEPAHGSTPAHSVTVRAENVDEWNSTSSTCTIGCGPATM
ncbi:hypothetical protein [Streptomyces sp. NPDC051642]|uniref:hypothetical protein n=1 Tax=unclassified Streptomyces TaxID=2593676 RepID=UPI00343FD06C